MSVSSSSHRSSSQQRAESRAARVRDIVLDVADRRERGERISDEDLLAANPDLVPALSLELAKLRRISNILDQVDETSDVAALERIEADWLLDSAHGLEQFGDSQFHERDPLTASTAGDSAERLRRHNADATPAPQSIGRYQVRGLLGEGGFGRVYLAWDQELKRHVAVKVPHAHRVAESADIEAYLQEARLIASLDHAGIVPVFDVGRTTDGHCYVVSKLIQGEDLAKRIKQSQLEHLLAARIIAKVAEALNYAHAQGLVHRDIKPANILLDERDRPYVADFGLALRGESLEDGRSFAGTPAYMSPEQARGESHRVNGRSDIFSLGVVFYELLTRRKPFRAESSDELLVRIVEDEPLPPSQHDSSIPGELERICLKAMAKRAADRYATARELADDLLYFVDGGRIGAGRDNAFQQNKLGQQASTEPHSVRVVTKGLRAFDANDADFFLDLLPGARDRDGLPESIRRWKLRIEERDADETFAVGLLYGPSGCGKSSFVRAGLLPVLSPQIQVIYVEAMSHDTEEQLASKLHKQFPMLSQDLSLVACLAAIRRGEGLATRQKALLVIDQFEQWLHGRRQDLSRPLIQALRHCDGEHLQCLLLVRDDFWLALSRFMHELEIDLLQGRNTALVDLFDPLHARKVLAEFGRSFGRVASEHSESVRSQDEFLVQSVEALSDEGKVIPVRLALFAEMVKGRPWTPNTLRELGGADGVGLAFLEETFSARAGNLQSRAHEQAARAVLEALLPDSGSDIKGHVRSYPELLDISGYGHNPHAFKELMRILDSETRLLTPVEGDLSDNNSLATEPLATARCYQLTHDYLVPALRQWLTKRQKATPAGRAELRLAERATMWNARPEHRQLPSMLEWLQIRLLTRASLWTATQHRMMRAAARRHAMIAAIVTAFVMTFLLTGSELATQAENLLVRFRANTASIWIVLGQEDAIWPLLKHHSDPTLRTQLIHRLSPLVVDPNHVLSALNKETDVSTRRAMLLLAGELAEDSDRSSTDATYTETSPQLIQDVVKIYDDDPDRGMHAAAEWTLLRLGQAAEVSRSIRRDTPETLRGDRQWFVSTRGHTMVIVPGPAEFTMGSPADHNSFNEDELLHSQQIRRSFSIASKETTIAQFETFLSQNRDHRYSNAQPLQLAPDCPQTAVSWYDAAAYCNWLSAEAGLPQEQWCYEENSDGKYAAGMTVAGDIFARSGYRLPTEAEWEYACRAGATTPHYFGRDDSQLDHYAVFRRENDSKPERVGSRKPNDYGLFDTHGNVAEWCHDRYRLVPTGRMLDAFSAIPGREPRVVRGGSFQDAATQSRSAARDRRTPGLRDSNIGFRVARSYP